MQYSHPFKKSYSRDACLKPKSVNIFGFGAFSTQSFYPLDVRVLSVGCAHRIRISTDTHRFSTPQEYIGKRVSVTIAEDKILIYDIDY